jgi:hypothetical protein
MKIAFSIDAVMDYVKDKRHYFSMAMIIIAVITSLVINNGQAKKIGSLTISRDAEMSKSQVLTDISNSEKTIKSFMTTLAKRDIVSVTDILTNTAKTSNVALVSIKKSSEENQPLYTKSRFVCVIGADSYHDIGRFISRLENHPGVFYIDAISINAQDEGLGLDSELFKAPKPKSKLSVDLMLSIIAFKG